MSTHLFLEETSPQPPDLSCPLQYPWNSMPSLNSQGKDNEKSNLKQSPWSSHEVLKMKNLRMYFCIWVGWEKWDFSIGSSVHAQSCPTLRSYGLWPARFLHPWDFAGKNTGVGCHFLIQWDLSDPGIKLMSPVLVGIFFSTEPPGKPIGSSMDPYI